MTKATAYFAESIPTGMDDLTHTEGVKATADALIELTKNATETIDLTAMYWALEPNPKSKDEKGWSVEKLKKEYRADRGIALLEALDDAAARGVKIRIIQSPGFDPDVKDESVTLQEKHPDNIQIGNINMPDWYGSGIMHQKVWVFDNTNVYVGSANMDWKSLTQVKEIGVVVENSETFAEEVSKYYQTWWEFVALKPNADNTAHVFDPDYQVERMVPAWSPLLNEPKDNPLDTPANRTAFSWQHPMEIDLNGESAHIAVSGAPNDLCVGDRTHDQKMLVQTILNAEKSVCVSVMDFAPISLYRGTYDSNSHRYMVGDKVATPVWWPALVSALLHTCSTKNVHGRLLISEWAHTSGFIAPYLEALDAMAEAARSTYQMTGGKLEIKRFQVPGWDSTGPIKDGEPAPDYPGHTRVNHTKYIVTDKHANIGTSNMTWDYFSGTAGTSVNTTHSALVGKLQEIFDRDWKSQYAVPNKNKNKETS
ncbi:MAG: phospholipase D-like domain-containing protein [Pseudomonadota bacterium]